MISSVSGGVNSRSCMKRAGNKRAESRRASPVFAALLKLD